MNDSLMPKLLKEIDTRQSELQGLIQRLIQIPSPSGQEQEIVEFVVSTMKAYGFHQAFIDRLGNAVGRIGEGPVKILYDAHLDTVAVNEGESWAHPPYAGKIVKGKIYGRGAVDEKPAMAGFLVAGRALAQLASGRELPFTLYVVGSVLEEDCDGFPLRHLVEGEGIRPDYVVLGEPTDLRVYRGQRGRMELQVTTAGKAAHGAHNQEGINAIYKMMPLIQEIEALDQNLPVVIPLGKGSITVSQVTSRGPSLCSVPDHCQIHIDRRMTVGETRETVMEQLREIVDRHNASATVHIPQYRGKSWKGLEFRQDAYFPTWVLEEKHLLVQAGLYSAKLALGKPAVSGFWGFSTNGVATAGELGIPTIGFAPGKEELAHTTREELVLDDLFQAALFYGIFPFVLTDTLKKNE